MFDSVEQVDTSKRRQLGQLSPVQSEARTCCLDLPSSEPAAGQPASPSVGRRRLGRRRRSSVESAHGGRATAERREAVDLLPDGGPAALERLLGTPAPERAPTDACTACASARPPSRHLWRARSSCPRPIFMFLSVAVFAPAGPKAGRAPEPAQRLQTEPRRDLAASSVGWMWAEPPSGTAGAGCRRTSAAFDGIMRRPGGPDGATDEVPCAPAARRCKQLSAATACRVGRSLRSRSALSRP